MNVDPQAATAELPKQAPLQFQPPLSFSSLVRVDIAARSDRGKLRPSNEDHFLVARTGRHLEVLATNLPRRRSAGHFGGDRMAWSWRMAWVVRKGER